MRLIDLTGEVFGRLTVVKRNGSRYKVPLRECKCECGSTCYVVSKSLLNGSTRSCGCYRHECERETLSKSRITHGQSHTRLYRTWTNMLARCSNPKESHYPDYGGRGITVCDKWRNFETFAKWANNNGYTEALTIDRINVNGNYEPNNCRWTTMAVQNRNKRTTRNREEDENEP